MKDIKISKSITNRDCDSLSLFFKDIYKYKPLSQEEETELAKKGDKASLDKLVLHNLRFVITVAKQYQGQGLPLEDLIAEGISGMIVASQKFNPDKGFKFISYAVWWIRQSIIYALYNKSKTIRTTTTFIAQYNKLSKITAKFLEDNERYPSNEELSELSNIPVEQISKIYSNYKTITSLENQVSDEALPMIEVIENTNAESPEDHMSKINKEEILKSIIGKLPEREQYIIINHFGLFGEFPKSFEDISSHLSVSGERARQICNAALQKLKDRYGNQLKSILQ